ncbi:MAG: DoxX family protein [Erythrobacter sp.]
MQQAISSYDRVISVLSGRVMEGAALLVSRISLAGIFWRSGRTKVVEGTWLEISDTTRFLFETEYAGVPLPPDLAAHFATYAELGLPILLALGLGSRFAAFGLLMMTLVIQFFVYPDAWWSVHVVWVALAALIISRGGGLFSIDALLARRAGSHAR